MRRVRLTRFLVGGISAVLMLAVVWYFAWWSIPSNRLNLILVTLDTTRADRVGCYGYAAAQTPAMDALAKTGAIFEFARTPYPLTLPAHASILTGLNPPEHGLQVNGRGRLNHEIPLLPQILQNANYQTGAFIAAYVLNSKFGLNRGFETYDDDLAASAPQQPTSDRKRDGRLVLDLALDWMRKRTSRPFFCWIHLYDPHGPYVPRTATFGDTFQSRPYDSGIAYADMQLERLREFIAKERLIGQTLIVVVGDHGEGLMEHNEPDHGYTLYDSTLRVPLIFAGPSFIKPGVRVSTPVSLVDLTPTLLDCLSIPLPKLVAGRSIKPALMDETLQAVPCYSETELPFLESRWAPLRSVTTERWKYIETARSELYDLIADPNEDRNLADVEPAQAKELAILLNQLRTQMTRSKADSINLTPNEQRILASLGYVGGTGSPKQPPSEELLPDVKDMLPHYVRLTEATEQAGRGNVTAAIETVREILRSAPGYSTARFLLGDLLLRERQFAAAAIEYSTVARDQTENAEAHARWGNALAAQGMFEESAEQYLRAIEIDPDGASYHYYFAFTLIRLGKSAEAINQFQAAIKCNPAFVEARLHLGRLFADSGRAGEAIEQYEAALKHRPGLSRPLWLPNGENPKKPR